jgi:hypothetical protein
LTVKPSAATRLRQACLGLAAIAAAAGFSLPALAGSCVDLPFRMAESFQANIVECDSDWAAHYIVARGGRFKLYLEAHLQGSYWYQPVKAYFKDSESFDGTSDWGEERDADRRFDYATFRGDLLDDYAGVLSCVAITRHSSPHMGRGLIAKHLVAGIYCDEANGDAPIPDARINEVIDAIEFEFE